MEDSVIKVCFPYYFKYLICKQLKWIYAQAYMHNVFVNDTPLKDIISIIYVTIVTVSKGKFDWQMKMVVGCPSS